MSKPTQINAKDFQAALQPDCQKSPTVELSAAQILKAKLRFMEIAREVCPGFSLEEHQKPIVNEIFRWCMRLPGKLNHNKGLWIWGNIGTGKSTMMQIVNRFCYEVRPCELIGNNTYTLNFCIRIRRAIDICDIYAKKGYAGLSEIINIDRLCIDDIGTEGQANNHYGNVSNVIGDLLLRRYDMRHNFQTHATSNFKPESIAELYDPRIFDRCGEIFNFIEFPGYTHRPEIESI